MTRHVCIFTTAHPWDDVRVKSKFAESFLDAGDKVTWIGPDRSFFEAAASRDPRIDYRLLPAGAGWKGRIRLFGALRHLLRQVPEVDWIYTPDPDGAALALSARTGAKIVFDIHEEYHKGHFVEALPKQLVPLASGAVRLVLACVANRVDQVTAVNQAVLDCYNAPPSRSIVTFNTPPAWFTRPSESAPQHRQEPLILFHGKALATNGTPVVLAALQILKRQGRRVRVIMLPAPGASAPPYDPSFADQVQQLGVADMLELREAVPHRQMPALMAEAEVGLIAYGRALGEGSLPNRFFEYLALGMPVLVPSYSPLMVDIVQSEGAGWVVDFEDPNSLAAAIAQLLDVPAHIERAGVGALSAFKARYAWQPIFERLQRRLTIAPS